MKRGWVMLAAVLLLAVGLIPGADAQGVGVLSHYIVFEQQPDGAVEPVFYRQVILHADFFDDQGPLPSSRDAEALTVRLIDGDGIARFATQVRMPVWVRGEFHGENGGPIEGFRFLEPRPAFVVRAPVLSGTRLMLENTAASASQSFDLAALAANADALPLAAFAPAAPSVDSAADTGSSANRVDLVVMGEGYTNAQSALFNTHFDEFIAEFFGISPYDEYRSFVKVEKLFTASAQSGADHPPYNPTCSQANPYSPTCCADSTVLSDALAGTFVSTAFDGTFCAFNIHRLMVVDNSKVFTAASAYPNWDQLMVMVNDPVYGGAGGSISTFSRNDFAIQIAQHEYGHVFARLADEYSSAYPGFPACSDAAGSPSPCEDNVTDITNRAAIKWLRWIDAGTPVITPPTNPYLGAEVTGLFAGARYDDTAGSPDYYRPGYACIMRFLGAPYCAVAAEAYALRFYQGDFSVNTSAPRIELIEPGTASPDLAGFTVQVCDSRTVSAQILAPLSGSTVTWTVDGGSSDGATYPTGEMVSYTIARNSLSPGLYPLTLTVQDVAPIIHPTLQAQAQSVRTWNVTITTDGCASADVRPTWQGRPTAPAPSYEVNLEARLYSGTTLVDTINAVSDANGHFTFSYYQPGMYTLWVKGEHTLASRGTVTLTAGTNTVTGYTMREGDANNDNAITIADFSLMAAAFGRTTGQVGFNANADFNQDGAITIADFALLAANFGQAGAAVP